MRAPGYVANFDSAAAMLRALGHYLHGKDFPTLGLKPEPLMELYAKGVNLLPEQAREMVYSLSGAYEGASADELDQVDAEELSRWMVGEYPRRRYPAVALGSSGGAVVHLCAALGIPWLPQTVLIPVRRTGIDADDLVGDMEWGREPGRRLLDANPDLQLHHMHDPNQDWLMVRYMTYLRVKRLRLGETMERFITDSLSPGGTLFLVECEQKWPTVRVGSRHYFQPGAVGGLEPEEYLRGSERVADFLARYGSSRRSFRAPETDAERPEAEWGFEPKLRDDVERFAAERGYRVRRIVFPEPHSLSPLVAELYRWWYAERGIPSSRLVGEQFVLLEPWWMLRTGSVPFWTPFGVERFAEAMERYLDSAEPYDEIYQMLFSHGTESAGLAPPERWRQILRRARREGRFLAVDEEKFPKDFGSFGRYHAEMEKLPGRVPLPGPLPLQRLDDFLDGPGRDHPVRWISHPPAG